MKFEWDEGNTKKILARFEINEVEAFFHQELLVLKDEVHSIGEERYIAVGLGKNSKPMFVCFTMRDFKIRVISARFMKPNEARKYEKFKKKF